MARKKYTWGESQQWNSGFWQWNWVLGLAILEDYFEKEEKEKKKKKKKKVEEEEEEEKKKKGVEEEN